MQKNRYSAPWKQTNTPLFEKTASATSYQCREPVLLTFFPSNPQSKPTATLSDSLPKEMLQPTLLTPLRPHLPYFQSLTTPPLDNQRETIMTPQSDHINAKVLSPQPPTQPGLVTLALVIMTSAGTPQPQGLCTGCFCCTPRSIPIACSPSPGLCSNVFSEMLPDYFYCNTLPPYLALLFP